MGAYTSLYREINKAKKDKRPLIVVENIDDLKFYENILKEILDVDVDNLNSTYTIVPIQFFTSAKDNLGTSGCTAVTKEYEKIQKYFINDPSLMKYTMGIIDRDSFYYLAKDKEIEERRNLKGIFTLRYYSFESYGLTEKNLKKVIEQNTNILLTEIGETTIKNLNSKLEKEVYNQLYYVGLDCLKHAIDKKYKNEFSYSEEKIIADFNSRTNRLKKLDLVELDKLAENFSFQKNLECIKKIVKGKHLMYSCASQIAHYIISQVKLCERSLDLTACTVLDYCVMKHVQGKSANDVLCKWKSGISEFAKNGKDVIYRDLVYTIDVDEVWDIINAFKNLNFRVKQKYSSIGA